MHDELLIERALNGLYPEQSMTLDSRGKERLAKARAQVQRVSYKITGSQLMCGAYEMAAREVEKAALMLGYERGMKDGLAVAGILEEGGASA